MYDFAIMVMLALAALKVADFLADNLPSADRFRSLFTILGSIGAVWLLNYSLFDDFGVKVRNHASGVWITAAMVAGVTVPWRAAFSWLTHDRAAADETLGEHRPLLRKVS